MRWSILLLLPMGIVVNQPGDAAVENDLKKLQGGWVVTSIEVNGMKLPDDKIGGRDAAFKGNEYAIHDFRLTVKVDPAKKPKSIDMNGKDGNGKPLTMIGIYELNGDMLKICLAKPGSNNRPAEFKSRPNTGESLIVYKRKEAK